ncbi:MAG: hypothetical protein R6U27_03465 [Desulfobacterales bacterium]
MVFIYNGQNYGKNRIGCQQEDEKGPGAAVEGIIFLTAWQLPGRQQPTAKEDDLLF